MPTDLQKARELFLHAVGKLPPEQWQGYVAESCGSDAELEQQVGRLLQVHREAGSFLDRPAAALGATAVFRPVPGEEAAAVLLRELPGTVIGPYKLLQQIGEGGMGTVFMAEQTQPVQRKVALKIIKPGMDSKQVIARFEAERQALAMMDHLNIARVLDVGATDTGRPYFVMELVHGVPITKYCDDNRLTPRQRLELFVPVCQAIQHAHQKGIIHRDIKPSNVMITLYDGKPVPKVIDFGVAKATEQRLTERTLFTQYGTMVGTPEYMSPEQAEMSALGVDTRSDIFSLGVLMYELLTGSTPLSHKRVREAAYGEVLRMIKEEEPPRPSTRLSDSGEALASISAQRHMEPAKLTKLMRGELDWIVMKTLEKDRNRRYETANGFAADVQRYLNDEPVQACPPSALYRFRKLARRNKRLLAPAGVIALALVLGTAISTWQAIRATHAEGLAQERLETANANYQTAEEQRQVARTQEELAKEQRGIAVEQEKIAKEQELTARRRFYAAQMNLAMQAWETGQPARVLELLESQRPRFDEEDLRVFEWYYLWRLCHTGRASTWRAHKGQVNAVAFSPDGKTMASGGLDRALKLWDVATGQERAVLSQGGIANLAFSPDGKTLAASSWSHWDKTLKLWDVATGGEQPTLPQIPGEGDGVGPLAFSPDGQTLAGGTKKAGVILWDIKARKGQRSFEAHSPSICSLAFSPDGKTLATVDWGDTPVKVWDLGSEPPRILFQVSGAWSVAFSPDGKTLATGAKLWRTGAKLWDAASGKERVTLQGHKGDVTSVAF
ncbi:MAG: hypothetical protein E6K70_19945, partial [Planctomycetota bacterium]